VDVFVQVVASGLAAGCVYGLVAIGHGLVYRLTGTVYLALGDVIGLGIFTTLLVAAGTGPVTQTSVATGRFLLALVVGVLVCLVAGAGGYLLAVQPFLQRGSTLGWVGGTLALAFAIHAAIESFFPRSGYVFPDPIPFRRIGEAGYVAVGDTSFQVRTVYVAATALLLAALATWAISRTRSGRGMQAIASERDGALVVGVPVERLVALAFGLAGGVAALAAITAAPSAAVSADTGTLLGVKGLAAALAVRFGPAWMAFAAGAAFGVVEAAIANVTLGELELGPEYSAIIPLALVLLFLAVRPPREALEEVE
jgi:branched-subunit amino acid ABC-type transport system permease component